MSTHRTTWSDFQTSGGAVGRTFAESTPWWPKEAHKEGAPNIIVMVMDDMGYSDIGPYGAEIATPNLDKLALTGYRFTNYHTPPVCSPARAALLTGLNPHRAGYASVVDMDPGFPNYAMEIADDVLTMPEILREHGYATLAIGKWHLSSHSHIHDAGSKSSFPLQRGFDRYYGTMEGLNSFFHPNRIMRDNSPVAIDEFPDDYYLTDDLTDEAIGMIKGLRAAGDKPFFLYFCHQAVHGPLGARPEDLERQRGRYAEGWDELRRQRFEKQKALGLFPADTQLPGGESRREHQVEPWDSIPRDRQILLERHMEVYAAMIDSVDQNLGRLTRVLEELGELDNTIIVFTSDNGGTMEGGPDGTRSYFKTHLARRLASTGSAARPETDLERPVELIGGPQMMSHYPKGWGQVSNTPFRLFKGNTFAGGVRVPLMVSWPAGLPRAADDSGIRSPYQYVTDLLPTLLDLAALTAPTSRHGHEAKSRDGASMGPVLRSSQHASTHSEQYAEYGGHRGFYRDGWKVVTFHQNGEPYSDREWELYHVAVDPTETLDVAAEYPDKLDELAAAWEVAAEANQVFPLNDGSGYLTVASRYTEPELRKPVTILGGTPTVERRRSGRLIELRSFDVDICFTHHSDDAGVLLAHGDQGGGYQIHVVDNRITLSYNAYGDMSRAVSTRDLPAGDHVLRLTAVTRPHFTWDLRVDIDGELELELDQRLMLLYMAPFSGIDVGICRGGPVDWSVHEKYGSFAYGGAIDRVVYQPGERADYDPAVVMGIAEIASSMSE